jgi:hypothetical protein
MGKQTLVWAVRAWVGCALGLIITPTTAKASATIDIPGVSRILSLEEHTRIQQVIESEITPIDVAAGSELLQRLNQGKIKVWLKKGFGFTNPMNGIIAIAEPFLSLDGTFTGLKSRKLKSMDGLLPFLAPETALPVREKASQMFLASMLFHENIHCRQGRRYWVIGDVAVLAASNLSTALKGPNPMELEAYTEQLEYTWKVEERWRRNRSEKVAKFAKILGEIVEKSLHAYQ